MNHRNVTKVFLLGLGLASFTPSTTGNPPDGYSYHQLDNGLEIILLENPSSPMVGINTLVKRGSIDEDLSTNGVSHMLEHLLFNGTDTRTQKQLYDDTDLIGGYNNANTADTYTNFMFVTPSPNLERAIEIQADMLFNSTIPLDKFAKEKGIVLEEIGKALANPTETVTRNLKSILYTGTSLALPTLGTVAAIENLKPELVKRIYQQFYVPNNMLVSVVGNFRKSEVLRLLKKYYGQKAPKTIIKTTSKTENTRHGVATAKYYHRYYSGTQNIVHLAFQLPSFQTPVSVNLMESFLQKTVAQLRDKLATSGGELFHSLNLEISKRSDQIFLLASLRAEQPIPKDSIDLLEKQILALQFHLSDSDLKIIFEHNKTAFFQNLEKPHMFGIINASLLAQYGADGLIQSIQFEEYLKAANELAKIDGLPLIARISHHPLKENKEQNSQITRVKVYGEQDGFKLIVSHNPLNSILAVHFLFGNKVRLESEYGENAAWILHDCLSQRMKELISRHNKRGFGFLFKFNDNPYIPMDNIYMDDDFSYVRAEALEDHFAESVPWVIDQIENFQPTLEEFERAQANYKRIFPASSKRDSASQLFSNTINDTVYKMPDTAGLPSLTFNSLQRFTKVYFDKNNLILSIVSSQEADRIAAIFPAIKELKGIPKAQRSQKSIKLLLSELKLHKTVDGNRAFFFGGFTKTIQNRHLAALKALSVLLSEQIQFKIREELGMAYGINSGIEIIEDRALFYLRFATAPKNIGTIQKIWPTFFQSNNFTAISEITFKKTINKYLGRMAFRKLSSINQGFYLGKALYNGTGPNDDQKQLDDLKKLNLETLYEVALEYLDSKVPLEIIFSPEDS